MVEFLRDDGGGVGPGETILEDIVRGLDVEGLLDFGEG